MGKKSKYWVRSKVSLVGILPLAASQWWRRGGVHTEQNVQGNEPALVPPPAVSALGIFGSEGYFWSPWCSGQE